MTMDRNALRAAVFEALSSVAPEADPATLRGDRSLRDQLDIDSFDFLNVLIRLHDALGVEIPEADYGRVGTLDGAIAYLEAKLAPERGPAG